MGFQGNGVTVLNVDGTYRPQKQLFRFPHEWIDLIDIPETNLYCSEASLAEMEKRLRRRRTRGAVLIGSGNYHYVTYLLLKEINEPFTLVLFDHHTDAEQGDDRLISCGSWVAHALQHAQLRKVVIVGPSFSSLDLRLSPNITVLPFDDHDEWPNALLEAIPTRSVYISIDKDALRREDAVTNWDQGRMPLFRLLACLRLLLFYKKVLGVDICGEYPQAAVDLFDPLCREARRKNEQANSAILETCFRYAASHLRPA
ncbi:arginase family protein [Geobacillus subterraneus]|uniref:arginase family protein n=1 Tax=Geobacillus subterraneus TaxID=129338 RepID=UPI00161DCF12